MQAVVVLPQQLQDAAAQGDLLAAFCGTQCRGVAQPAALEDGTPCYTPRHPGHRRRGHQPEILQREHTHHLQKHGAHHLRAGRGLRHRHPGRPPRLPARKQHDRRGRHPRSIAPRRLRSRRGGGFVGGELAAAGVPVQAADGTTAYALTIRKTDSQASEVVFQYYNARYSYLYVTDPVATFAAGSAFGTLDAPQVLPIGTKGKYPFQMTAYVSLPEHLAAYADGQDELAAFAGDECRGVAEWIGAGVCRLTIIGNDEPADLHVRYYSGRNAYLYQTDAFSPSSRARPSARKANPKY